MNDLNEMDQDTLLNALLMSSATESDTAFESDDDDDFDENWDDFESEEDMDDDDDFESDFEGDYESAFESDDDFDDDESANIFDERRRRRRGRGRRRSFRGARYKRRRSPRLRRVKGSKSTTLRAPNGQRMKVQFGKSYATSAEVNKLIKSTQTKFAAAMKERKANHAGLTKQIAKATSNIDGKIARVNKKVKSLESQAQTSSLLGLLSGPPKVKTIKLGNGPAQEAEIAYEPADLTLPLLLGGGLGGGSGGDNTLLLALMLGQNKDKK